MSNAFTALANGGVLVSSDFETPSIDESFPDPILFGGMPFATNRMVLVQLIAVATLFLLCFLYYKKAKLVPGRAQGTFESILDFPRNQVGHEILGERAKPYQPLLATIFMGLLFTNITGIIPGLQIASTSIIGIPLIFAIVAYVSLPYAGTKASGAGHSFKEQLFLSGAPKPTYIFMMPIELLSTFVIRPLMLTIRLLASMVSGHLLLVPYFLGTHYLYLSMSRGVGIILGSLTLAAGVMFTLFEAFVTALQAYIFALLVATYILLSIEH